MRNRTRTNLLIGFGVAAVLVLGAIGAANYFMRSFMPDCIDEILHRTSSPDNQYVAITAERGCGATTDFVRVVALYNSSDQSRPIDESNEVYIVRGRVDIITQWKDSSVLLIQSDASEDLVFKKHESWGKVKINYN